MTRIFPLAALAALSLTGFAAAQTPAAPPPPTADVQSDAPSPPPSPGGFRGMRERGPMRPPFSPPRGARFHFSRGDARVDVRCAENETMRACVDAASALLDKLASQAR